jgi:hypothetical protein
MKWEKFVCRELCRSLTPFNAFYFGTDFNYWQISEYQIDRDGLGRWGSIPSRGDNSLPALVLTQTPVQWVQGAVSSGVKRQGREADHSPPSSVENKSGGAILPHPYTSWYYHFIIDKINVSTDVVIENGLTECSINFKRSIYDSVFCYTEILLLKKNQCILNVFLKEKADSIFENKS